MLDDIGALITGIAEGAARGAAALREEGLPLDLDGYTVEASIGSEQMTAEVRLDFVARDRQ